MQPDILGLIRKLDIRFKYALASAFVLGIISQGMGLFNKFSVHDDPINYGVGATYTSGRWMLDILANVESWFFGDGHYSLPVFNGVFAIILIAVSACLIIDILELNSPFLCAFIAGIMVSFPVITSIFGYMFTLHFYMISLFFGTLGAYCVCKFNKWYMRLIGIVLMGASVGIYQAFIPTILTIILFYLINYVLKNEDIKALAIKVIISGVSCALFMVFYFVSSKLYLASKNAVLSDYKGIDSMGKSSLQEYLGRAIDGYKEFFIPDLESKYFMYPGAIFNVYRIVLFIAAILIVLIAIKLFKKSKVRGAVFSVLIMLIPLSVNFIFVMTGRAEVHSLMVYAQLMPFVFFAWVLENQEINKIFLERGLSIISTALLLSVLIMYFRVDNKCYLKATYAQQEAISYFTSLVSNIKEADGYKDDYPVVFVNSSAIADISLQPGDYGAMDHIKYAPYSMDVIEYVNDYTWQGFMKQWTGYSPTIADGAPFAEMDEVKQMPSYPDDGAIRVINDTVVVKF